MTGQIVRIKVKEHGDGTTTQVYCVAEPDALKAQNIMQGRLGLTDEIVESVAPVPKGVLDYLGLTSGQSVQWQ